MQPQMSGVSVILSSAPIGCTPVSNLLDLLECLSLWYENIYSCWMRDVGGKFKDAL